MTGNSTFWKKAIHKIGISSLTEMQQKSLEVFRTYVDIIILAPTGSGKTLAFLLPVLELIQTDASSIQILIITPSRELALQIEMVFKSLGTGFKVNSSYGGHSKRTEFNNFSSPPAVLIGTPGRIADHILHGSFRTDLIHTVILDEFDKSLEFGFQEDMAYIMSKLPGIKKRVLCSATNLEAIPDFTGIKNPYQLNYLLPETNNKKLIINVVRSSENDKLDCLFNLLCDLKTAPALVFCNHRDAVERISSHLKNAGIINDYFHGGLEQPERERMLIRFRNGSSNILITTDLASRGLDIPEISYIIHYQIPPVEEIFIHRNGRTARMNSGGSSYLLLSQDESLPGYLNSEYQIYQFGKNRNLPEKPIWQTLYIGGGKKDKINKIDIAGFLLKQGGIEKNDLGYIEVKDHHAYAAIKSELISNVLNRIKSIKIKNRKVKFEISY